MALSFSEMPVLDRLCGLGDLLLEVAKSVHQLIILLPDHIILQLEKEELLFEHKGKIIGRAEPGSSVIMI